MQYLKELASGNRVKVDEVTHIVDSRNKAYRAIVKTSTLVIYALQRAYHTDPVGAPLHYGGRGTRDCRPWNGA